MKHSERFALNEWMSDYPQDATFDEVCDLLLDEDPAAVMTAVYVVVNTIAKQLEAIAQGE